MDARLQKALDGDIGKEALTASEQVELVATATALGAVVRAIPVEPLPDLAPEVLRQIRARAANRPVAAPVLAKRPAAGFAEWLWRPRSISVGWRPAYALAAAVVLAVLITANSMRPGRALLPGTQQVLTQFVLKAPDARNVALAGDFTGWQPAFTMTRTETGVWTVVIPLDPGIHQYSFVVDGVQWIPDPTAPSVNDGFGSLNSRIAVLTPDSRGL